VPKKKRIHTHLEVYLNFPFLNSGDLKDTALLLSTIDILYEYIDVHVMLSVCCLEVNQTGGVTAPEHSRAGLLNCPQSYFTKIYRRRRRQLTHASTEHGHKARNYIHTLV
jgi:hypothetical protein